MILLQLNAPLFITWFQCVISLVCLFLLSFLGEKFPWIDKFPAFSIDFKIARQVCKLFIFNTLKNVFDGVNIHSYKLVYVLSATNYQCHICLELLFNLSLFMFFFEADIINGSFCVGMFQFLSEEVCSCV